MAPKSTKTQSRNPYTITNGINKLKDILFNPTASNLKLVASLLLIIEPILNAFIINRVPYTEIDWIAYMQEVAPVIHNKTYDYSVLKGDTGPLVYPAGFVWFFSALYWITEMGTNIRIAQYIFAGFYLVQLSLVFRIMIKTEKIPPFVLIFMSLTSYRIHSIYVLRLFNDPIAMLFLYASINLFISDFWTMGSLFFSLAVSIKMNILLFAPALFLAYLATQGIIGTIFQLIICGLTQLILALPFLMNNPVGYLKGAFDLGRIFMFKWTVNWRFLPEDIFVDKGFHLSLLIGHCLLLIICFPRWWKMLTSYSIIKDAKGPTWSTQLLVFPLFMSNFIGIALARSLHYQFYVWYYHQLHYLLWCTKHLSTTMKLLILGIIEMCWNTYPSTVWSSGLLHFCHLIIMICLFSTFFDKSNKKTQ